MFDGILGNLIKFTIYFAEMLMTFAEMLMKFAEICGKIEAGQPACKPACSQQPVNRCMLQIRLPQVEANGKGPEPHSFLPLCISKTSLKAVRDFVATSSGYSVW